MRLLLTASILLGFVGVLNAEEPAKMPTKIPLKVLYAGVPDSTRTKDFVSFLESQFTKVGTAPYTEFSPKLADGFDVVVFDAGAKPNRKDDEIGLPKPPNLPRDFDRATVLIGGAGTNIALSLKLKIDWL
jgi:hypothetical protein